jgi:hypothetical protein
VRGVGSQSTSAAAPPHARSFVAVLVATLVVCALVPLNLWPFSNWELFSRLRMDRQTGWALVAVDSTGRARAYPVASLARGYRSLASVMANFSERSVTERNAACAAWLQGARERFGSSTRVVRIYRLEWLLSDRQGNRAAPPHTALAWVCTGKGAREAA